jgi:hypothetical protein
MIEAAKSRLMIVAARIAVDMMAVDGGGDLCDAKRPRPPSEVDLSRAICAISQPGGASMKHAIVIAAGLALAASLSATSAQAQNARSFVSGHGLDTNACTLAAPCRTFAVAFAHTNAGGEIDVLDTAGYGPLTIDKAISIVNDGSVASVLPPLNGNGITITAGTNDAVSLRGLTIEGAGVGVTGIVFNTGKSLVIENCVVRHFTNGIEFLPNASSNLSVSNTLVADNVLDGIFIGATGSGVVIAALNRVEANNNRTGITVSGASSTGNVKVAVNDSVAAGNFNVGFGVTGNPGNAPTTLTVSRSVTIGNGVGIGAAGAPATLRVTQSTVTGNSNGWQSAFSGVLLSAGDNTIEGNAGNETAPPPYMMK